MATELIRKAWCDVCLAESKQVDAVWSKVVKIDRETREIDLCREHTDQLVLPLSRALWNVGRAAVDDTASGRALCPVCGASFSKRSGLKTHMTRDHPTAAMPSPPPHDRPNQDLKVCPVCSGTARGGTGLSAHMRFRHPAEWAERKKADPVMIVPPVPVQVDGVTLPPFLCPHCERRYSSTTARNAHVRQKHPARVGRQRQDVDGA